MTRNNRSKQTDDERDVSEGDTIVFTNAEGKTEGTVSDTYDDGSFIVEWESNGEERGEIFKPKVFDRSAFIEHVPNEEPNP